MDIRVFRYVILFIRATLRVTIWDGDCRASEACASNRERRSRVQEGHLESWRCGEAGLKDERISKYPVRKG